MSRARGLLALILAVAPAVPASAQTGAPKVDCRKATATVEMNYCEELELAKADKALNEVYRATLARIDGTTALDSKVRAEWRTSLQDAQRKWIAFRDADCKGVMAYEWYGGTGATLAVLGCMRAMTLARTKELRERNER
jgi:uncharacterized protein YecT (DUF1311 family)